MWRCKDCGNTDMFIAEGTLTITVQVDSNGKFTGWEDESLYEIEPEVNEPFQCVCGSNNIHKLRK